MHFENTFSVFLKGKPVISELKALRIVDVMVRINIVRHRLVYIFQTKTSPTKIHRMRFLL